MTECSHTPSPLFPNACLVYCADREWHHVDRRKNVCLCHGTRVLPSGEVPRRMLAALPDPDSLEAAMARHPSNRGRSNTAWQMRVHNAENIGLCRMDCRTPLDLPDVELCDCAPWRCPTCQGRGGTHETWCIRHSRAEES